MNSIRLGLFVLYSRWFFLKLFLSAHIVDFFENISMRQMRRKFLISQLELAGYLWSMGYRFLVFIGLYHRLSISHRFIGRHFMRTEMTNNPIRSWKEFPVCGLQIRAKICVFAQSTQAAFIQIISFTSSSLSSYISHFLLHHFPLVRSLWSSSMHTIRNMRSGWCISIYLPAQKKT